MRCFILQLFFVILAFPGLAFAQLSSKPCYDLAGKKRLRQVLEVESDGTIKLDGNERVLLAGVELPSNKKSALSTQSCLEESLNYIRARVGQRSVFVIEAAYGRDSRYRQPAYLLESSGGFVNLELIRFGFATADKEAPGNKKKALSCASEFADAEKSARMKKIAGWKSGCLHSDEPEEKPQTDIPEVDLGGEVIDF